MSVLLLASALASSCGGPSVDREGLDRSLGDAAVALDRLDWSDLEGRLALLRSLLPCLGEPILPGQAAEAFRLVGWSLFSAGDPDAVRWLAAGFRAQPGFAHSPALRGPMATAWADASSLPMVAAEADLPGVGGALLVNGLPASRVPRAEPWILQHVAADGSVASTWLIDPDGPIPVSAAVVAHPTPTSGVRAGRPVIWWVASGVALGLGTGGLLAARATKSAYDTSQSPDLIVPNRIAGISGYSLLAVGGGLGAVAVLRVGR
ncbi:MAG: hypothetical protein KC656_35685 [Myxococcales bacterium]|nr:hypothetical protein [Myxococcales bacterium]